MINLHIIYSTKKQCKYKQKINVKKTVEELCNYYIGTKNACLLSSLEQMTIQIQVYNLVIDYMIICFTVGNVLFKIKEYIGI